jgi:hypothetical protein
MPSPTNLFIPTLRFAEVVGVLDFVDGVEAVDGHEQLRDLLREPVLRADRLDELGGRVDDPLVVRDVVGLAGLHERDDALGGEVVDRAARRGHTIGCVLLAALPRHGRRLGCL